MRGTLAACVLAIAASTAQAISITYPTKNATIDTSSDLTIEWSTVSSDPSTVDITIVGTSDGTQTTKTLATGVSTSSGSHSVDLSSISSGSGYQIDFISTDSQNTGILAQSQQFIVENDGSSSSSSASSSATASGTKSSTASGSSASSTGSKSTGSSTASGSSASATSTSSSSGAGALKAFAGAGAFAMAVLALM